ncbi:LysR family transcriptional regulator [Solemya pervernicosa gill symbiont]|uniref:LysR family transcriptional regulator n=2 Tax=Gammaproteobacteria incertae sedis TaxID=118884 RepID=A0A1T2L6U5_9GAMM|nr:LysR family transcriptional regulator [Candidatus Reidiella endopervernicosa]OOZ40811.1 LysR family transcriptional regulator [Solemya pervernicosa gill symbiont]QKQ26323.1 LysR family transcriptional regulator [Candidatus Reidiella endopervernicosa]
MDIPALNAFVTVAESGSFSLAAELIHLTQPAISKRITALESELNCRLFDRISRQTTLTEAGAALLPRARQILEQIEDSKRTLTNLSGTIGGQLTIGTSHHIGLHRLPPILRSYVDRYPQVDLDIRFLDSEAGMQAVLHGELELGLITLPTESPAGLITHTIWEDPLAFIAAHDHPLTKLSAITASSLANYDTILPSEGTYTRQIIEAKFAPLGITPRVSMATNYLETIKMLVSVGLGWSVLPRSMVDEEVSVLNVEGIELKRILGLVQHPQRTLSNAASALKQLLLEIVPSEAL